MENFETINIGDMVRFINPTPKPIRLAEYYNTTHVVMGKNSRGVLIEIHDYMEFFFFSEIEKV